MPFHKDLSGKKFGRLSLLEQVGRYNRTETLYKCMCDCGNEIIARSGSLTKNTRPTRSCGCLKKELDKVKGLLPFGEAHFNRLHRQYIHNAKKRNVEFNLSKEEFRTLITNKCTICDIPPKKVIYKGLKFVNGFIDHNGIDRIDNNKGYTLDNVQTMCTDCNRAKSNLTNQEFLAWVQRIVKKNI